MAARRDAQNTSPDNIFQGIYKCWSHKVTAETESKDKLFVEVFKKMKTCSPG